MKPGSAVRTGILALHAFRGPRTGTIVLESSCDPFGTNPFGRQIFARVPMAPGSAS
jgi:hypothetical protein